jgi:3-hydroxyacyl-CoA dehydrogenase/3a,7a,12a-trihydroxy-5b-cholest-24-enoyl-CoA hydratase
MGDIRFDGKVAVITGAGRGLGRAHALLLASRGAKVVINDLGGAWTGDGAGSATPADEVVNAIKAAGGEAIANYDSVLDGEKIVQAAIAAFGRIDIVINNAGILRDVSFHKMTDEDWKKVLEVHLFGSWSVTKAAWPRLRDQGYGRVVMTTSAAGLYGNFGQANYSAAKMGIVGLGFTLAHEGEKKNVKVNVIAPIAGSRMTETVMPKDMCDKLKPEYVSPLVAYLCSEQCPVNGGVFEVGAGVVARVRWLRSKGVAMPLTAGVSIENVAANWEKINDMAAGQMVATLHESTLMTMQNLSTLK